MKQNERILLIGPLPEPTNGCSYANQVYLSSLRSRGVACDQINTASEHDPRQGSFRLGKVVGFLRAYAQVRKVRRASSVYFTPGQTRLGLLKYAPFMLACVLFRRPYIVHVHGNHLRAYYDAESSLGRKLTWSLLSRAAWGVVLSDSLRHNLTPFLPHDRICVIPNFSGAELEADGYELKDEAILHVVFLSNLIPEKGYGDLLDALDLLRERGVKFRASIAGAADIQTRRELESRLSRHGPAANYLGVVQGREKRDLLWSGHAMVLPTYYAMEGQPISLLEGMMSGNILVTTRHAGIEDVVSEANGFFVSKRSPKEIADVLEDLASNLKDRMRQFSRHNRSVALTRYTEKKFVNSIYEVQRMASGSR